MTRGPRQKCAGEPPSGPSPALVDNVRVEVRELLARAIDLVPEAVVNEAGLQALIRISESVETDVPRLLTREDFDEALTNFTPPAEDTPPNPWRLFAS